MKMFDMIVDTTSNNEIKKSFLKMECDCAKSFCVVVGTARAEFCKKNYKRKRGGAGVMVGHCSRIIHHSILYYSL